MTRTRTVAALLLLVLPAIAQDLEFLRALENAQRARPAQLTSTARIAPEAEPGTALVVHGRAFAADGSTLLAGAIVFAYHTNREGVYDRRGAPAHSWRLKGWARTGADGRFEFRTIRPGHYPGGKVAAHIHMTLFTADGAGYHAGGVLFDDDALVSAVEREESRRDGVFGSVCSVRREGTVEHIDFQTRVVLAERFAPAHGPVPFVHVAGPDLDGREVRTRDHAGKVLLVAYWATSDERSLLAMPGVVAAHRQFHDRGLEVVGISLDEGDRRTAVVAKVAARGIPWPTIFDGKGSKSPNAAANQVLAVPATFLIDRRGRVRYMGLEGEELGRRIAELLAEK